VVVVIVVVVAAAAAAAVTVANIVKRKICPRHKGIYMGSRCSV
jgi:hypothetical protein